MLTRRALRLPRRRKTIINPESQLLLEASGETVAVAQHGDFTPARSPRSPGNRYFVELCCEENSALGQRRAEFEGCHVVRITRQIDFTTPEGLQTALGGVRADVCTLTWVSIPIHRRIYTTTIQVRKGAWRNTDIYFKHIGNTKPSS
ncbi:hypothetical protein N9L68_08195 [bacterium]|nr:hypothetical protein [bacterium]